MVKRVTALVPRLRFPEFRSEDGWEEKPLKNICKINPSSDGLPDSFIYIDLESVEGGVLKSMKLVDKGSAPSRAQRLLRNGDIVFQIVRPYQRNNLLVTFKDGATYVASTGYAQLRANESELFLYQAIHTDKFVDRVVAKCTGSNYPAINSSDLADVSVPMPPSEREQQKIADCLTSLDEVIAAQGQKVEALRAYKRGLMQQLFPHEGEAVPRLRFPEFRERTAWNKMRFFDLLDDVIDFRGRTPKKLGLEWGGGEIVSLSANNVKNGFIDYDAECNLGSDELYSHWMEGVDLAKGDIVFTMEAPLGNALLVPDARKYILSQRVVAFKTKPSVVNEFLIQLIWSEGFQKAIELLATGSTAKGISQKSLQQVYVSLPNEDEQDRIAQCLSPIDAQLFRESEKLHKLKEHRKGLMQQLFPSPAEVET